MASRAEASAPREGEVPDDPRPRAKGFAGPVRARILAFSLVVLATALAYAPVFSNHYAFSDDWWHLDAVQRGDPQIRDLMLAGGRPLLAAVVGPSFRLAARVDGLAALRAAAVLGIALLAAAFAAHLVRHGWALAEGALIAVVVASLPSFRVFAAWACAFAFPWASLLAGGAHRLVESALEREGRRRSALLVAAAATLALSFLVYQPAAAFFWAFATVATFGSRGMRGAPSRHLYASLAVYGAAGLVGLAAARVGARLFPVIAAERASLASNPLEKAAWFARGPLVDALNIGSVRHWYPLAAIVAVLVAVGLAYDLSRAGRSRARGLAAAGGMLLLAFSPSLAVSESSASYRSEVALAAVCAVLAAHALRGLASRVRAAPALATRTALAVAAALSLAAATFTVQAYVVRPQVLELAWLRAALSRDLAGIRRVQVIAARPTDTLAPRVRYDELGVPSFAKPWVPGPAVRCVLRERGEPPLPVELIPAEPPPRPAAGTLVLDARTIRAIRR